MASASRNDPDFATIQASDGYLAELLGRVCALAEFRFYDEGGPVFSQWDANWLKIHRLLVRIHENMGQDLDELERHKLILKLGLEVALLETLAASIHAVPSSIRIH